MVAYAKLGICKIEIIPLDCDGAPDPAIPPIVYCGLTDLEENPVLTEAVEIDAPSGMPNRKCIKLRIPPELDYIEVVLTTCPIYDPALDALLGYSDVMENAAGNVYGSKALKKGGSSCVCACGDDACTRRVGLCMWSLAVCSGDEGKPHPDGRFVVTCYPALEFRLNEATKTTNVDLNGREYLAIAYENENFGQGPDNIIPADQAPFDRCSYEFLSDVCPPEECDCGVCGDGSTAGETGRVAGRRTVAAAGGATRRVAEPSPTSVTEMVDA